MTKNSKFAVEDIQKLNIEDYDENEYCIAHMKFLSTRPNSHEMKFSEEVLRRDAPTILGTWIVSDIVAGDFSTHVPSEHIIGIVPKNQSVEFNKTEEGYLDAYVDAVLSKRYAKDAYDIFVKDNNRSVSIEFNYESAKDDENYVESFVIRGTTILGKTVNPSVPTANMTVTRFSADEADKFFTKVHNDSLTALKHFVEERKESMATTYKIDKSKESVSETPWGEVDKTAMRNKIMEASNRATLVKSVYMLVEAGWEEAPSEHLKYPVMQLKGDTFVYNRYGLASALGYAEKEGETSVVRKVKSIYNKLGLDSDGKEGDAAMSEANFEIEGRKAWAKVIKKVQDHEGDGAYVDSIEDTHIIYTKDNVRYRVEADIKVSADDKTVDADIKWDTVKKDADQKMSEDCGECKDDCEEDFATKCAELEKAVQERDNIIMEKDKLLAECESELSDLREFKKTCMEKEKVGKVESVMSEVKDFIDDATFKSLRDEGIACDYEQVDAWSNKVKACSFEMVKGQKKAKKTNDVMWFSAPIDNTQKVNSLWK